MVRGSFRLDLKRDDARTLMLKMDARLTYAGRERNVAYQLEGKRELRQLESTLRLLNADLNRAQKKIQKRIDFFQALQKQNRERRQMREIAWCGEEEREWEREARAARRRRMLPKIEVRENHKAEVVGSIRRDQKREFANKMTRESHLNRSLNALSNSYAKHRTMTERNVAKLAKLHGESDDALPPVESTECPDEPKKRGNNKSKQLSLPHLPTGKYGASSSAQKTHQSHLISDHNIHDLPAVSRHEGKPTYGRPDKKVSEMVGSFYMNTSTSKHNTGPNDAHKPRVYLVDSGDESGQRALKRSQRRVSLVDPSTQSKNKPKPLLSLGSQHMIPLRFYEPDNNPFKMGTTVPALNRSRDLINAEKADEMYIWLGLESEEELEKLRRGELVIHVDDEEWSDTSSNAALQ